MNDTMNNAECAIAEFCLSDRQSCDDINEAIEFDITNNNQHKENTKTNDINYEEDDTEFPPMISMRGKQPGSTKYIWAGYVYARDGYTRSFRCSNRQLYQCPGRAMIKRGTVKETKAHSHSREPHILQIEEIKQAMILRAQTDKSIGLRAIYLEACKKEPLARSHLGLDMMLGIMKKARNDKLAASSKRHMRPKKKLDLNFNWTKDWLEIPSGQNESAFCKVCATEIASPTNIRVYNHFLSKMHKHAVLGFYRPTNSDIKPKSTLQQRGSTKDSEGVENGDLSNQDSDHEDTYVVEVLDQFQDEVDRMKACKKLKMRELNDHSAFYEEVIGLKTTPLHQVLKENDSETSNRGRPRSLSETELSKEIPRVQTISVHVWDSNTAEPTSGLEISLHKQKNNAWSFICKVATDHRGKCSDLLYGEDLTIGIYKLNLNTKSHYSKQKQKCLYPYIEIIFEVQRVDELYHFHIQLSPFAYNVCRLSEM